MNSHVWGVGQPLQSGSLGRANSGVGLHLDPLCATRQSGCLRVTNELRDRPVSNALDSLVDHMERYDEPFSRLHRFAETILDGEVELHSAEQQSPTRSSMLDTKGAGEAGTAGAPWAGMNAINDALAPFGVRASSQPITPEKILRALGKV